ncbi:MAG: MmcQ/YjbR family DNA-binding protein [Gemmatimonadaceae bacterium]|nr:MmcQ/YjbR family DNA-binding protein [Gemmatimonadaceae bacterium]
MPADPLPKFRALCLALPSATEKEAWGEPTFRAGEGKLFAMFASASTHHGAGRPAAWIKAMPENQRLLIASDPDRYFSPPYVGPGGWVGVWLDRRPPWSAVRELLEDGYRQVAARKLLAVLDGSAVTTPTRPRRA